VAGSLQGRKDKLFFNFKIMLKKNMKMLGRMQVARKMGMGLTKIKKMQRMKVGIMKMKKR